MTHYEQILKAVKEIVGTDLEKEFRRVDVRDHLGISAKAWKAYSPIFQGMRIDQPGKAPDVPAKYRGTFRKVRHGTHVLTEKGRSLLRSRGNMPTWRNSVLEALNEIAATNKSREITRRQIIARKLDQIVKQTHSVGETPEQTLSRILQELRDDKILDFVGDGHYLLIDKKISVDAEDLSEKAIDIAIQNNKLLLPNVPASNTLALTRIRKGQARLHRLVLQNYAAQCAICDIKEKGLLIASHISRWADNIEARGDLSNAICLCIFHDPLFERGYFSFSNDLQMLFPKSYKSRLVRDVIESSNQFRMPSHYPPSRVYLMEHRLRCGLIS